jgi:phage terminase small subunit
MSHKGRALSPKRQRFVAEYLKDMNATQAAIRAGYSEKTARSIGSELLTIPDVAAAVAAGRERIAGRLELSAEKVLRDLEDVRERAMRAEQFAPAVRAIELCGKHLGMFVERTENNTNLTVADAVDRPVRETRDQWIARRSKELGVDARLLGASAGTAD